VQKTAEYRQHAKECRNLAKQMRPGHQREQLLAMARTWDALANERETMLQIERDFGPASPGASAVATSKSSQKDG
jgi:hypothetical protein